MKILFVNPFGIGDVLFTTALIRPLRERGHSIHYWCNERVEDILSHNGEIKGVFALSRGDLKKIFKTSPVTAAKKLIDLMRKIKKERFDVVLDFSLDSRYSLLLRILGIKKILGFDYKGRGRFLTKKIQIDGFDGRHMVEQYAALLKCIDKRLDAYGKMELFIGESDEEWADSFLRNNGIGKEDLLMGIAPGGGTSWGESAFRKHWPKEKFAYVADKLASEDKYRILLLGSQTESDICGFIARRMKIRPMNLCGKTTLGQFAALLSRCGLLITNDGGPLHMAAALGVRTISIFGPVDDKVYGPYPRSADHTVIVNKVDCRPCYRNFRYPLCHNRVCLDSVEPSTVIQAARARTKNNK